MKQAEAISGIQVSHPDPNELKAQNVSSWPIWSKEASTFDWHYDDTETCFFLEGKVTVKTAEGEVAIGKGDLVTFPKDLSCTWVIHTAVRKHYNFS